MSNLQIEDSVQASGYKTHLLICFYIFQENRMITQKC